MGSLDPTMMRTVQLFCFWGYNFDVISQPQPLLAPVEQDTVYTVLGFDIPWCSLFPDDLCISAPHGVVCDFFYEILLSFSKLKKLKVLDLGCYYFSGNVPKSVGNLSELVKEGNDLAVAGGRRTGAGSEFGMGIRDRVWGYESSASEKQNPETQIPNPTKIKTLFFFLFAEKSVSSKKKLQSLLYPA
ncbi:hypothetical protein ACFX2F_002407 [Malus domestica]